MRKYFFDRWESSIKPLFSESWAGCLLQVPVPFAKRNPGGHFAHAVPSITLDKYVLAVNARNAHH